VLRKKQKEVAKSKLPSVPFRELHPNLREVLSTANGFVISACTHMVAYVMLVDQVAATSVTIHRLTQPDVLEAVRNYSSTYSYLNGGFRKFLKLTGNFNEVEVPKKIHPELLGWITATLPNKQRERTLTNACMSFLKWICKDQFPMYQPDEIPVQFIIREYLVRYRRHLIQGGQRRKLQSTTLKRNMQYDVVWIRWLQDQGKITDLDTTGLAIRKSQNAKRELPTYSELSIFIKDLFNQESPK